MPRKINLEFTCDLDHCIYGDRKCLTRETIGDDTHVCPYLTAYIPRAKPKTCAEMAMEAYDKLRVETVDEAVAKMGAQTH